MNRELVAQSRKVCEWNPLVSGRPLAVLSRSNSPSQLLCEEFNLFSAVLVWILSELGEGSIHNESITKAFHPILFFFSISNKRYPNIHLAQVMFLTPKSWELWFCKGLVLLLLIFTSFPEHITGCFRNLFYRRTSLTS